MTDQDELENKEHQRQYWLDRALEAESKLEAMTVITGGADIAQRIQVLAREKGEAQAALYEWQQALRTALVTVDDYIAQAQGDIEKLRVLIPEGIHLFLLDQIARAANHRVDAHNSRVLATVDTGAIEHPHTAIMHLISKASIEGMYTFAQMQMRHMVGSTNPSFVCWQIVEECKRAGGPKLSTVERLDLDWWQSLTARRGHTHKYIHDRLLDAFEWERTGVLRQGATRDTTRRGTTWVNNIRDIVERDSTVLAEWLK